MTYQGEAIRMVVYGIIDKRTGWILYVGKTTGRMNARLRGHFSTAKGKHPVLLSLYINEAGEEHIGIIQLESGISDDDLLIKEDKWIKKLEPHFNIMNQRNRSSHH